ncbi:hypothetical protein [Mucilaginibacter sp. 3215]|uniref:hypothetical protein n=1 Tax=Mucilaginibacter sp. 3215 TaxID=3373912 RepID=UPI003D1E997C
MTIALFNLEYSDLYCWFSDQLDYLLQLKFDRNLIVQYSMIIAGFISITIPIALGIVSTHTSEYKDKEISNSFLKEWTYQYQVYFVLPIIYVSIGMLSLSIETGWMMYLLMLVDLFSIIVFIMFIRIVQQYATNFDDYFSRKLKKEADEIIQG